MIQVINGFLIFQSNAFPFIPVVLHLFLQKMYLYITNRFLCVGLTPEVKCVCGIGGDSG